MALALLAKLASSNGQYRSWHPLLAASVVAHFSFGRRADGVSEQINLYLLSRVVYALAKLLFSFLAGNRISAISGGERQKRASANATPNSSVSSLTFPVFASLVWAVGLWLFENHPWTLQRSLRLSMEQLYGNGNGRGQPAAGQQQWGDGTLGDFLFK